MLEDITKSATIGYVALTLIGIFKQAIYYRAFGLNIFEYLQLSEVLVLSINDITLYVSILTFVVVVLYILDKSSSQFEEENLLAIYEKTFFRRHISFRNKLAWVMFLLLLQINALFISFPETRVYWFLVACDIACFFFYCYLIITVEVARAYYNSRGLNKAKSVMLAQIIGMFLFFLVVFTMEKALNIRLAKHKASDVELYTENLQSPISKYYLFVGKTEKYIIVFDYKKRVTIIYSSDFIKKMVFI